MKSKSTFSLRRFLATIKFLLLISFLFSSCDSKLKALLGKTKPATLPEQVSGAYALVRPVDQKAKVARGELIAATDQVITLLADTALRDIPLANCSSITLYISKDVNHRTGLSVWAVILPFTTIAHGGLLILTFPLNLIVVVPALFSIHGYYITSYPDHLIKEDLSKFARFPQGLPMGVSYKSLK